MYVHYLCMYKWSYDPKMKTSVLKTQMMKANKNCTKQISYYHLI